MGWDARFISVLKGRLTRRFIQVDTETGCSSRTIVAGHHVDASLKLSWAISRIIN